MAKNSECFGMEGCNICHTNTHDQEKRNKNKLNMVVNIICLASLHYQDYFFVVVTVWTVFTATIFKASALWADAFYKSKCPYVCVCVCVSVCLFTFEVPFNGLCAPTS